MSKIDYPSSVCIYSKDSCVKQHKRCFFNAINVRADYNQIIEYVIWEHCGKGSGAFWAETHRLVGGKTRFCLQDIKDICRYNGVPFEINKNTLILKNTCSKFQMDVQATISERDNRMYIKWEYRPYTHYNFIFYINEACTDEHLITVLDMEQVKQMFDFDKL